MLLGIIVVTMSFINLVCFLVIAYEKIFSEKNENWIPWIWIYRSFLVTCKFSERSTLFNSGRDESCEELSKGE